MCWTRIFAENESQTARAITARWFPVHEQEVKSVKKLFRVEARFCDDCSLALRRFIGHLDGIESISVDDNRIAVEFNTSKITEQWVDSITRDSLDKLGYKLIE